MARLTHEQSLIAASTGRSHQSVSDAMLTLNSLGHVVDEFGSLTIDGERVVLRVDQGGLVAVVGGARIPWSLFRQALKPKVTA